MSNTIRRRKVKKIRYDPVPSQLRSTCMTTPVLQLRGFLAIGPTGQTHFIEATTPEEREQEILVAKDECRFLESHTNGRWNGKEVTLEDIRVLDVFSKDWCGTVDFSAEAVSGLEDWDTAYAKLHNPTTTTKQGE